jgi:hypothetical protein
MIRRVKRDKARRVTIGVEADRLELQTWGRAAQLRRLDLDAWVRKTLSEAAEKDDPSTTDPATAGRDARP